MSIMLRRAIPSITRRRRPPQVRFVKPGDTVEQFTPVCEVQSDKAAVEITSRYDGTVKTLHYKPGDVARVGQPLLDIETEAASAKDHVPTSTTYSISEEPHTEVIDSVKQTTASPPSASPLRSESTTFTNTQTLATPAVRRIAKENNLNLSLVRGSGPDGRILKGDVLAHIAGLKPTPTSPSSPPSPSPSTTSTSTPSQPQQTTRKPLTKIQRAMYKSMTKSLTIPHFSFSDEITLNATTQLRAQINAYLKQNQKNEWGLEKISYMPIFVKTLSVALRDFEILNCRVVQGEGGEVELEWRESHNVGVAMDTPQGLLVPNIKSVHQKSILQIAQDLQQLRTLSSQNALQPSHFQNGTITLSNIGSIGGTVMHPVLVDTEVCIGAVGSVRRLPRFEVGEDGVERVVAKEVMGVSFSADHRVVDGATVARFVRRWKGLLEEPGWLLAGLK
ncbi:hypothetical protein HK097_008501 [Rhizophlyctis rosea]|uniref:Dihydrolipoamide acetyltransferase component of pyruvate dehydrogenase complex n=1 Tax=Rhizophlyctis rosea TaxID=64517 RepID=A0AAD5SBU2_9FUNG|nr:hypothetical protein HK097_008501 [Rhizophlyctis rosea]